MQSREPFIHKLLRRLDKVDRDSAQNYLSDLARENSTFQEILETLSEGVVIASAKGRLLYANRQALLWLGIKSRVPEQTPLTDAVADSELSKFLSANLSGLKERLVGDIQVLVPREMTLRAVMTPLEKQTAEKEILILLSDISNLRSEADLNQKTIHALSSLAAGIAHEIGNPLNAVHIHLELLKKELRDLPETKLKKIEKTLSVLTGETSRLDRIIRNFLKATRKPPLRFKHEDLNQILSECVSFMEPELRENGIKLKLQLEKSIPPFLMDKERLAQAFINLIKNAQEAMPKGGTISVSLARKESSALISFKDDGRGISEADLPHIFEAYYTTKEEGAGLGLMNVYNVVREHGGRIDVTSKESKGSLFILHLPIRQPKLQLAP